MTDFFYVLLGVAIITTLWVVKADQIRARKQYIHTIKEIEYIYQRLGMKYEKPPVGFGSTKEVQMYQVK
jgi:hypothetical protein